VCHFSTKIMLISTVNFLSLFQKCWFFLPSLFYQQLRAICININAFEDKNFTVFSKSTSLSQSCTNSMNIYIVYLSKLKFTDHTRDSIYAGLSRRDRYLKYLQAKRSNLSRVNPTWLMVNNLTMSTSDPLLLYARNCRWHKFDRLSKKINAMQNNSSYFAVILQ